MKDITYYNELQQALEKSWQNKRGGWSSPSEVARYTDESATLLSMRELTRKGMATEKRPNQGVFKPRKGAAGGGANLGDIVGRGIGTILTGTIGGAGPRGSPGVPDGGLRGGSISGPIYL